MKKISVLIPCYNEEELIFIDNDSKDNTRILLRDICKRNKNIKAIFNAKNFGQFNSPYYGILQTTGDCVVSMVCDFQDPIELIPQYVKEWENGYKIVIGIKEKSDESKFVYGLRTIYYKMIQKFSNVEQIRHFTGSGLYDREFIEILRELKDPTPFLRGIVAEFGYKIKKIPYTQPQRRAGKTKNNFYSLYDAAMLSFTSYTKIGLRIATFMGMGVGIVSALIGLAYLIMKIAFWDRFNAGYAPMMIGMFFLGSIQLFFLGFIGEYIMSINARVMNRPLVIEEERINFEGVIDE